MVMPRTSPTTLAQLGSSCVEKISAQQKRIWLRAHNGNWEKASSITPRVVDAVFCLVGMLSGGNSRKGGG